MKKFSFCLLSALIVVAGCDKPQDPSTGPDTPGPDPVKTTPEAFTASFESFTTKTSLSGEACLWSSGDQIVVYSADNTDGVAYKTTDASSTATFTLVQTPSTPLGDGPYTAVYSSNGKYSIEGNTVSLTIGSGQAYAYGSFDPKACPSVAVSSTTTLVFKPLVGILSLGITGDPSEAIEQLILTSAEGNIVGKISATVGQDGSISYSQNLTANAIAVTAGSGVVLGEEPAWFNILLPDKALARGVMVKATSKSGVVCEAPLTPGAISKGVITKALFTFVTPSVPGDEDDPNGNEGYGYDNGKWEE